MILLTPLMPNTSRVNYPFTSETCINSYLQELMSGEAVKECVTTAYTRVTSKSLANELPNKETTLQIKRHSDNIKTHVFRNSDMRNFTLTQNAP